METVAIDGPDLFFIEHWSLELLLHQSHHIQFATVTRIVVHSIRKKAFSCTITTLNSKETVAKGTFLRFVFQKHTRAFWSSRHVV